MVIINMAERVFEGDINQFCANVTFGGQLGDRQEVTGWAKEIDSTPGLEYGSNFGNFASELGIRFFGNRVFGSATRTFEWELLQRIEDSPQKDGLEEKDYTPEAQTAAVNFIISVGAQLETNMTTEDAGLKAVTVKWYEAYLPRFRQASLIADTSPHHALRAAITTRDVSFKAYLLKADVTDTTTASLEATIENQKGTIQGLSKRLKNGDRV